MPNLPRGNASLTISSFDRALVSGGAVCDLRPLKFIDAYGLVGTACAMRAAGGPELLLPTATKSRAHLSHMGFRDFLALMGAEAGLAAKPTADNPDVVVPLRPAADSGGAQALSNLLWEQLAEHVAPQVLNAIAEGVWEMVGNALEHSGTDAGARPRPLHDDGAGRGSSGQDGRA